MVSLRQRDVEFTQPMTNLQHHILGSLFSGGNIRVLCSRVRSSERAVFRGLQLQEAEAPLLDRKRSEGGSVGGSLSPLGTKGIGQQL